MVTAALDAEVFAHVSTDPVVTLLDIYHPDIPTSLFAGSTVRITDHDQDVVSNGNTYTSCGFQLAMLSERETELVPTTTVTIDNVDQFLTEAIRGLTGPATVAIRVVLVSDPDTIEIEVTNCKLYGVVFDEQTVQGAISSVGNLTEAACRYRFTPQLAPALFK